MINRKAKQDSDSDDDDYRKGYMKARKEKKSQNLPPTDFENSQMLKFNQEFAKNLFQERGLEVNEKEMGLRDKEVKEKVKKPQNVIYGGFASLEELKKQLIKVEGNIPQICTVLKDILSVENLDPKIQLYYSVLRYSLIIFDKIRFEDCKVLCGKILGLRLKVVDKVRVLIALAQSQSETNELWNAQMQLLRAQSDHMQLNEFDESELINMSQYDQSLEDVMRSLEAQLVQLKAKSSKDKTTISLLMTQGSSQSGALGLGEEITEAPDFIILLSLRGRQIMSLQCGENHVLALVSGCSCLNPYSPNFECKGVTICNYGCEVLGWGENFLGQAVGDREIGTFVSTPMIIKDLSNKSIVGVAANRSGSMAWGVDGKVYKWGAQNDEGKISIDQNINITNIVALVMGQGFLAILDISKNIYIQGKLQTTLSTQPIISHIKPKKLECQGIIQIAAGDNHLLALDEEGGLYGMGSNEFGQLGQRPSDAIFTQQISQLSKIEQSCFVSAKANLSLVITLEGELLYMGELTQLKLIDYPKTAQLPPDTNLISAQYFADQIYALSSEGKVFKWDPDNEPKFKLFQKGSIRDLQLGKGLRLFRGVILKGGYCSIELNIENDEDGNESCLSTFENINIELNLKDEFGNYGIGFTHPVRLHYFVNKKSTLTKKEIIELSRQNTLKQKAQNDPIIYPLKLIDSDEGLLIQFNVLQRKEGSNIVELNLQISQAGIYYFHLLLNEEFVTGAPLRLEIIKSHKEEEMIQNKQIQDNLLRKKQEEIQQKKQEKLSIEEDKRKQKQGEIELYEQKQRDTQQRAEESLKNHQIKVIEEQQKMEEQRKQKKDLLTGGGFNLDKLNAQQQMLQQNVKNSQIQQNQTNQTEGKQVPPNQMNQERDSPQKQQQIIVQQSQTNQVVVSSKQIPPNQPKQGKDFLQKQINAQVQDKQKQNQQTQQQPQQQSQQFDKQRQAISSQQQNQRPQIKLQEDQRQIPSQQSPQPQQLKYQQQQQQIIQEQPQQKPQVQPQQQQFFSKKMQVRTQTSQNQSANQRRNLTQNQNVRTVNTRIPEPEAKQQFSSSLTKTNQTRAQIINEFINQASPNKNSIKLPPMQLQKSALQQPQQNVAQIPRRQISSVQVTQRMNQTGSQFSSPKNDYQSTMSKTETKMSSRNLKVQNMMDPFQIQQAQQLLQTNKKGSKNIRVLRR